MMSSTQDAQSDLDRELAQLESLVLVRPPNVLLAEYFSALAAEEVLDAASAVQVSTTLNGLRYSAVGVDDAQVGEATASLSQVTARLAAMSPDDRKQISDRVRARIQRPVAEPAQTSEGVLASDARGAQPPARQDQVGWQSPDESATGESDDRRFEFSARPGAFVASLSPTTRRRAALPRISLEWAALAFLVIFFGGYFFRDAASKVADTSALPIPFRTPASGEPGNDGWIETVRRMGHLEARDGHYGKARLDLEVALAYSQENPNPTSLNELAWYYLLRDESGTQPQRALQLVNRALELRRRWDFLDTAAEAHFQLGEFGEAVRLEVEALTAPEEEDGGTPDDAFLEAQLQKFQEAERSHAPAHASATPKKNK